MTSKLERSQDEFTKDDWLDLIVDNLVTDVI
jgi:hypothetical protein